jgi:hypothetical protein
MKDQSTASDTHDRSAPCAPRHTHRQWLTFLKHLDAQTPADLTLHLIIEGYIEPAASKNTQPSFPHYDGSSDMMIVPEAANMPPTPWQTKILASGIWAGAVPRIWRTLSCNAYIPECM